MHYYKRNLGDYAKKAGRLSMLQHGAYTLLIDSCYDREQFPTMEEAIDWTWASTTDEIEAVEFVLRRFFDLEDGVYVQHRIREEIEAYREKSETNKRIALEREAKRKKKSTNRVRTVNETPPNQEPLTINHKKEKDSAPSQTADAVFSLPTNTGEPFDVTREQFEKWEEYFPGVDVLHQIKRAAAWLDASPSRRKTARGMNKFLSNWLGRAQDQAPANGLRSKNGKQNGTSGLVSGYFQSGAAEYDPDKPL